MLGFVVADRGLVESSYDESAVESYRGKFNIASSVLRSRDEPLQHRIQVRLLFRADAITGYLSMRDRLETQRLDQLVDACVAWKIGLVAEDEKRDSFHGGLVEQDVQFLLRDRQCLLVGRIHDEAASISPMSTSHSTCCAYTMAFTPRQYLSHIDRNLGWPPKSQLHQVSPSLGSTGSISE